MPDQWEGVARVTSYTLEHTCWSGNLAALLGLCLSGGLGFSGHVCIGCRECGAQRWWMPDFPVPYASLFGTKHTDMAETGELAMKDMVTDLADTELGAGFCILCLLSAV